MIEPKWLLQFHKEGDETESYQSVILYWNPSEHCWPYACNECSRIFDFGDSYK